MTTRPYELLARFAHDGTVSAHTRRMILDEEGKDLQEGNPVPLAGTTDPDFTAFATQFSASAIADLATANATIATLQARITALEAIRQFNPRWLTPDSFINRFTAKEAKAFYSSEDAMIVGGQQLLEAYEDAGYHVDLDDTQVQGLTGYMVQIGMLTAERREQVLRDATAQEAYYA